MKCKRVFKKKNGFKRRKYCRRNLQVKPYAKGNKVYLGRKIRGHGIFTSFGKPLAKFFLGI